jgi:hypothetical protein
MRWDWMTGRGSSTYLSWSFSHNQSTHGQNLGIKTISHLHERKIVTSSDNQYVLGWVLDSIGKVSVEEENSPRNWGGSYPNQAPSYWSCVTPTLARSSITMFRNFEEMTKWGDSALVTPECTTLQNLLTFPFSGSVCLEGWILPLWNCYSSFHPVIITSPP